MHNAFLFRYGIVLLDSPIWPSLAPGFIGLSSLKIQIFQPQISIIKNAFKYKVFDMLYIYNKLIILSYFVIINEYLLNFHHESC
mgnify:CR=1 FL=1